MPGHEGANPSTATDPGSSSGRTAALEAADRGSSPRPGTTSERSLAAQAPVSGTGRDRFNSDRSDYARLAVW